MDRARRARLAAACFPVALLAAGCTPYYSHPGALADERDRLQAAGKAAPEDPRYPQALYAVYTDMANAVVKHPRHSLPLTERVQDRRGGEDGRPPRGTCCLGGLAFTADILVVNPLRILRSVFTLPVAWAARAAYRRDAEEALARWQTLEPAP